MAVYFIIDFTVKRVAVLKVNIVCIILVLKMSIYGKCIQPSPLPLGFVTNDKLLNCVCFVFLCFRFLGILISGVPRKE